METYIFTIYNPESSKYSFYEQDLGYECSENLLNHLLKEYCKIESNRDNYEESLSKSFWEMKGDM